MTFECTLCNKTFSCKKTLTYHISHMICQKNKFICTICNREFASLQTLKYHQDHKVCENNKNKIKIVFKPIARTCDDYSEITKEELIIENARLKGELKGVKETPTTVNNNIVVFPHAYGKEDINHIIETLGDVFISTIKYRTYRSIPLIFKSIHNNAKLPEYHNIYINSEKSSYAMVSNGEEFEFKPKKNIIDQIIEDKMSLIGKYIGDNVEQFGDKVLVLYNKYCDDLDSNAKFKKDLEMEIGGLLLSMKSVIANDEKTRQLLDKVNNGIYV